MAYTLAFDFGTGGVRAGVYDLTRKQMVATAESACETQFPRAGWAEQNPNDWLKSMLDAGRGALQLAQIRQVEGVCVSSTASTVVTCKADGTPLGPALLWMDCRAETESRETNTIDHPVMRFCGGGDAVEWLVPKAMWIKRNNPELWDKADIICEAIDYINHALTGEWAGSLMNASCKWNYDSQADEFVPEIYERLGIASLIEKLPQRIVPVGGVVAPMLPEMSAALGLENQPLIAQGGIDAHIGMLGANVVAPGGMLFIGGTSVVQLTQLASEQDVTGFWGPYPNALTDGRWLVECGQVSSGSILSWLSNEIFGLDNAGHQALIREVCNRQAGAHGLLALDYWMGNRTPYRDGALRGVIAGLTLGHDRADIYSACVDAVALGSANVLAVLDERNVSIDRIVLAGGILKNQAWLNASIDAMNREVELVDGENLSLVGGAVSAATAIGAYSSLEEAAKACAVETTKVSPNAERAAYFAKSLGLYQETTMQMKPLLHHLASAQNNRVVQ